MRRPQNDTKTTFRGRSFSTSLREEVFDPVLGGSILVLGGFVLVSSPQSTHNVHPRLLPQSLPPSLRGGCFRHFRPLLDYFKRKPKRLSYIQCFCSSFKFLFVGCCFLCFVCLCLSFHSFGLWFCFTCFFLCLSASASVCICLCLSVGVCLCVSVFVCVCPCPCVRLCPSVPVCARLCSSVPACACMCTSVSVSACLCRARLCPSV